MSIQRKALMLTASITFGLFVVGCGGGGSEAPQVTSPTGGILLGNVAPEIVGLDAEGQQQTLSSLKGKVVILVFSTMWCGPCKAEAPKLQAMYQEMKDKGLVVLQCLHENEGDGEPSASDLKRWKDMFGLTFPVINPGRATVKDTYKIRYYPTIHVVDKKGVLQGIDVDLEDGSIRAKITDLLKN